jgi:molybdate transport system substrate-binding protein
MAIKVLSTLALKGVLEKLRPQAELGFDATQAILRRLSEGEQADLLILTREATDDLRKKGQVTRTCVLGRSGVGVAVRSGAPRPDIRSPEAFVRTLLSASSVAHSKVGASGLHFAALLDKLGIADQLRKRIVVEKGPVGLVVARGEAEIGVQQLCELAPVPGIVIVGPFPALYQSVTHFAAGIPAGAADPKGAMAIMQLLRSKSARSAMLASGMQPAAW